MNVLYPESLSPMADSLSHMGFAMHPMDADVEADAVLLSGGALPPCRPGTRGTLLVNARGLSAAQVAAALKRRTQRPIF